jgi:hypothetical protein
LSPQSLPKPKKNKMRLPYSKEPQLALLDREQTVALSHIRILWIDCPIPIPLKPCIYFREVIANVFLFSVCNPSFLTHSA